MGEHERLGGCRGGVPGSAHGLPPHVHPLLHADALLARPRPRPGGHAGLPPLAKIQSEVRIRVLFSIYQLELDRVPPFFIGSFGGVCLSKILDEIRKP